VHFEGEPGFPLNGVYAKPSSPEEADLMRQYFLQLRHETGIQAFLLLTVLQIFRMKIGLK
jgi:ARP2/3 complex ARPC3 (21 kDa) subunit